MQPEQRKGLLIAPGTDSRGGIAWAVVAAVLVAGGLGNGLVSVLRSAMESVAGKPHDLDDLQAAVFGLVAGSLGLAIEAGATWIGGRVARRMTRDPASLPRVARAYAWTLGILAVIVVIVSVLILVRLQDMTGLPGSAQGHGRAIGLADWASVGVLVIMVVVMPVAGRAGVLGMARRGRRVRARRT